VHITASGVLCPEEDKLVLFLIQAQEEGIKSDKYVRGNFLNDYFDPVVIHTIEHIPLLERSIPIPPGIYDKIRVRV